MGYNYDKWISRWLFSYFRLSGREAVIFTMAKECLNTGTTKILIWERNSIFVYECPHNVFNTLPVLRIFLEVLCICKNLPRICIFLSKLKVCSMNSMNLVLSCYMYMYLTPSLRVSWRKGANPHVCVLSRSSWRGNNAKRRQIWRRKATSPFGP